MYKKLRNEGLKMTYNIYRMLQQFFKLSSFHGKLRVFSIEIRVT